MKFIRHTGQTIATTVIRTPTVEKKENKSQGINHSDSNTLSENSPNITFDGGNGHGNGNGQCHQQSYKKAIKYLLCHVVSVSA